MGTQSVQDQAQGLQCLESSLLSSPLTLLWPSTSPRRDGTKSRISRPRPVTSPLLRQLPVLLSLTTSTVASTLATGTHTRTSPRSLMPSSRSTTASPLMPSTPPTWTPRRLLETSRPEFPFTPPVSVLVATLTDSVSPPESPSSKD